MAAAVRSEAQAWVRGIAEAMAEADTPQLEALRQQVRHPPPPHTHPGEINVRLDFLD